MGARSLFDPMLISNNSRFTGWSQEVVEELQDECDDQRLESQRLTVKRELFGSNIGVNGSSQSL